MKKKKRGRRRDGSDGHTAQRRKVVSCRRVESPLRRSHNIDADRTTKRRKDESIKE